MLEPLRNPANWDNFRKAAVLVLIIWAAASVLFGIIYFFILGGRSPAPVNIFRALILLVPFTDPVAAATGSSSRTRSTGSEAGSRRGTGAVKNRTFSTHRVDMWEDERACKMMMDKITEAWTCLGLG